MAIDTSKSLVIVKAKEGRYIWPVRDIVRNRPHIRKLPVEHVQNGLTVAAGKSLDRVISEVKNLLIGCPISARPHVKLRIKAYIEQARACAHHESGLIKACHASSVIWRRAIVEIRPRVGYVDHRRKVRVPRAELSGCDLASHQNQRLRDENAATNFVYNGFRSQRSCQI